MIELLERLLSNNPSIMIKILVDLGAKHINHIDNRVHFAIKNSSNHSHCIYLDSMLHFDYPQNICESFMKFVARSHNVDYKGAESLIRLAIGGDIDLSFEDNVYETKEDIKLEQYNTSILNQYQNTISKLFLEDGISPTTQSKFGIGYDAKSNRITIPIFQEGSLVGVLGRYNSRKVPSTIAKYLPLLKYHKRLVLFPFDLNKNSIQKHNHLYLVESEKTTLRCNTLKINNVLSMGGNCIKPEQIDLIDSLGIKNVTLILDKGLKNTEGVCIFYDLIMFSAMRLKDRGYEVDYLDIKNMEEVKGKDNVFDLKDREVIWKLLKQRSTI